ncbi:t-SNARE domain-containing protein 1 isoform X2 [Nothobranchius furzeri]|uniref:t-SNARE domain-containing protein 1 isoform X2 n=1 Tax=Nothobranchius furzeri TaxID=105023 RepID=UPI003904B373
MSYGSVDRGSFGSRNPFGGPTSQGYQPVATQVSPAELQDVFQETASNIFQINANVVTLEKNLQSLGTSRDTAELWPSLHSTQQQTNKVITSTSHLIKQLSDIISGSSRQDRLRLTRLKTELSDSVQRYGDLQKKIAERSRALLPPAHSDTTKSPQTPSSEHNQEDLLFGAAAGSDGGAQAFLSEISEEDVEVLRQREEALLQIERQRRSQGEKRSGTAAHLQLMTCWSGRNC